MKQLARRVKRNVVEVTKKGKGSEIKRKNNVKNKIERRRER